MESGSGQDTSENEILFTDGVMVSSLDEAAAISFATVDDCTSKPACLAQETPIAFQNSDKEENTKL